MARRKTARRRPVRFLWVVDPWETLDHPRDTTLRLAQAALAAGHESYVADVRSIRAENGRILLDAARVTAIAPGRGAADIAREPARPGEPAAFDQVHYRVDPPIDLAYLHPLQLLASSGATVVNPPAALFATNEKLVGGRLANLAPPTLISSQWERLQAFGIEQRRTVLKPLHEAQSHGVELLEWTGDEASVQRKLAQASADFTRPVLLQRFLPGIARGEQRLWFLDGRLLAWARKVPKGGDFRINMDGGSRVERSTLAAGERAAARRIGAHLRTLGVRLAAVDLIDGLITDFNVTSPGLIVQMEAALGRELAPAVVRALAGRGA